MNAFTVLQSVYKKDSPAFLAESLRSIADSTLLPEKVVLVRDGPLTPELESVIAGWQERLPLKAVGYEQNRGACARAQLRASVRGDGACGAHGLGRYLPPGQV